MLLDLSNDKQLLLNNIVNDLKNIENITAIVVGGSYAEKMESPNSDIDLGIYYQESNPFDINQIKHIANKYAIETPTVTEFYQWGIYVNGGAWITTAQTQIDLIYRNIGQVEQVIEKARKGEWENNYDQQPPYGFSSIIYLAETHVCIPLYDPTCIIANLKSLVENYPPMLKESVIKQSLWAAEFSMWHAEIFARKQDAYNSSGCLSRAVKNIVTALYGINELYPMGDKRSLERLKNASKKPICLEERINKILYLDKQSLANNVVHLKELHKEVVGLCTSYIPFFKLPKK